MVSELVGALESSLYGETRFSQADLEDEWSELDLSRDTRVVREGDRIVAYGVLRERGDMARVEGYVHPRAHGRGIGRLMATGLEDEAIRRGARRIQNSLFEADAPGRRLVESLGYSAARIFREMRIDLEAAPPEPKWPDGLRVEPFDPERDARAFYVAQTESFADSWNYTPRAFESWSKVTLGSERFDPSLWCVVRAGDEIAAGTICTADTYGGGFIHALFTRRPWRRKGVGAALLADAFRRLWDHGERSIGLGADAASDSIAFRIYERAGMTPVLGWMVYEKEV